MIHKDILDVVSLEFSALARQKATKGDRLFSLGLGEPFWHVPVSVRSKLSELAVGSHYGYTSPFGNTNLRRHIAIELSAVSSCHLEADNVLITSGAKQALTIALKTILDDQDEVIIIEPCYVSYRPQVLLANHHAKVISCPLSEEFKIDFSVLNTLITDKTKAIIVNTPNNPSGSLVTYREMEKLVNIAKKNKFYLISDEIYRRFIFQDTKFCSANAFRNLHNKIITIDGFSKTYSMTGWRIGYLVASQEFISRAVKVPQHEVTNVPEILQVAACEVFSVPNEWFDQYRLIIERNANYYFDSTRKIEILKNTDVRAGMFCFPKVNLLDIGSDKMAVDLLAHESVAVTPGVVFGEPWDKYLRISLSLPEVEFREAINRFVRFFRKF